MRLRFIEAGLKRLEAVAAEKISAETHLLKEKEEHLKEIEVLGAQAVDFALIVIEIFLGSGDCGLGGGSVPTVEVIIESPPASAPAASASLKQRRQETDVQNRTHKWVFTVWDRILSLSSSKPPGLGGVSCGKMESRTGFCRCWFCGRNKSGLFGFWLKFVGGTRRLGGCKRRGSDATMKDVSRGASVGEHDVL
ncbi:hypothetical protein Droror1_Dr00018441 [Drosera rotundifolia]